MTPARTTRPTPGTGRTVRHDDAVLAAEVRRILREVRSLGPLPRATLARRCRAELWREGGFDAAVRAGVRQGQLRQLPFGFIAEPPSPRGPRQER